MNPAIVIGVGKIADAIRASLESADTASGHVGDIFVIADAADGPMQVIARLREAVLQPGGAIVLIIVAEIAAIDRALMIAAIGPIAIERAPVVRVSVLDVGECADDDAVATAALFVAAATCTTGQVIRVEAG